MSKEREFSASSTINQGAKGASGIGGCGTGVGTSAAEWIGA
ncbi:MAG TPA: hypothetical protein VLI93_13680 [Acetobacteraceae bacterium]|nr:hypothetical protein [Acetobacteraceae bacterium]